MSKQECGLSSSICTLIYLLVLLPGWLAGFVLAKGFFSTLFCIIPFYAWYLVVERLMQMTGMI